MSLEIETINTIIKRNDSGEIMKDENNNTIFIVEQYTVSLSPANIISLSTQIPGRTIIIYNEVDRAVKYVCQTPIYEVIKNKWNVWLSST